MWVQPGGWWVSWHGVEVSFPGVSWHKEIKGGE